jgi:flagellar basal-body rod protein FlgF
MNEESQSDIGICAAVPMSTRAGCIPSTQSRRADILTLGKAQAWRPSCNAHHGGAPRATRGAAMASGIYISMSHASLETKRLDHVADRMANSDTAGFMQVLDRSVAKTAENNSGVAAPADKILTEHVIDDVDLRGGPVQVTGRPLDLALPPGAFLRVRVGETQAAFTRSGNLHVDETGLVSAGSHALIDDTGAFVRVTPGDDVRVSESGTLVNATGIHVSLPIFSIGDDVKRLDGTLVAPRDESQATSLDVRVTPGALEGANVNKTTAVIDMMMTQRHFAHAMQAIETYSRMDEKAGELGRIR